MACLDLLRSSSTLIRPSHPSQMASVFTMRFAGQGAGGIQLNLPSRPSAAPQRSLHTAITMTTISIG